MPVRGKGDSTQMCFECGDVISEDEEDDKANSDSASTVSDSRRARKCTTCRQESISFTNGDSSPAVSEDSAAPPRAGLRHTCSYCGKAFCDNSKLKRHVKIHLGLRDFKCQTCGKGFIEACSLRRHESVHSDVKPHNCSLCRKGFTDSSGLKKHLIKCNGRVKDAVKVAKCDAFKATDSGRDGDTMSVVTDVEVTSRNIVEKGSVSNGEAGTVDSPRAEGGCEQKTKFAFQAQGVSQNGVGFLFQTESSINTQAKVAHPSYFDAFASSFNRNSMVYICRECGRSCDDELSLRRHLLSHGSAASSLESPESCNICGKMFVSIKYLRKHMKNHADRPDLLFHSAVHSSSESSSNADAAQCLLKGNSAPLSSDASPSHSRHTTTPPSKTGDVSFGASIPVSSMLSLAKSCPGDAPHPSGSPPPGSLMTSDPQGSFGLNCEVCGKVFADASSLKRHARLHTEQQQQFPCENCDKVFGDQGSLKRHWLRGCRSVAWATGGEATQAGRQHRVVVEASAEDQFACTQCRMVSSRSLYPPQPPTPYPHFLLFFPPFFFLFFFSLNNFYSRFIFTQI